MSEGGDRRARKKAATRALVLETAQRLFDERGFDAVTVADIAGTADVAVQTVFNHFPTKEELFFADRAAWVDAPAQAVRDRDPAERPMSAVRRSLVHLLHEHVAELAEPGHRRMVSTMITSRALQAYERELNDQARARLQAALIEAWSDTAGPPPGDIHLTAALAAATWMATVRTIAAEARQPLPDPAEAPSRAQRAVELAERVFGNLETALDAGATLAPQR